MAPILEVQGLTAAFPSHEGSARVLDVRLTETGR